MEKLNFEQMENCQGGFDCSAEAQQKYSTIGFTFSILSSLGGGLGLIIFGPTAFAMGAASVYCAYQV